MRKDTLKMLGEAVLLAALALLLTAAYIGLHD